MRREARLSSAFGALACALAVAMGAYASHGVDGEAQRRLAVAALFAFGHGLALQLLADRVHSRLARTALAAMALGVCLFCGSLAAAAFFYTGTGVAPAGGLLLITAWVMLAIEPLRE